MLWGSLLACDGQGKDDSQCAAGEFCGEKRSGKVGFSGEGIAQMGGECGSGADQEGTVDHFTPVVHSGHHGKSRSHADHAHQQAGGAGLVQAGVFTHPAEGDGQNPLEQFC